MITLTRCAVSFACALLGAQGAALAEDDEANRPDSSIDPALTALLRAIPQWSFSATARAGYGYNDNLLLSAANEETSAFARGGADLMLLRVPRGPFEYSLFAEAERTEYFSGKTTDDDMRVWVQTEPGFRLTETLRVGFPITGYYYDQVFDVSDTDVERNIAELEVTGAMAGPTIRWDFAPAWWIEGQARAQRKRYDDRINDGDAGEGNLQLGWKPHRRVKTSVWVGRQWRDFERRAQYSAAGRELLDTRLKIAEREGELRLDVAWDEAGRWRTTTRASALDYRDNGSGYFDYRERKVAQDVEWRNQFWLVRIGGSASRLDFDVQTVGVGIDPASRLKDEFAADVQIERELSPRWTVFGGYLWERSRSNDAFASYTLNEGLLGVRWNWER